MSFDPKLIEAELALEVILTEDMPKIAWDALEAGLDGRAIRRLAALDFPTHFEIVEVLPRAMAEMGLRTISPELAAIRLAKHKAQRILAGEEDPIQQLGDFYSLWFRADYPTSLAGLGTLDDELYIAKRTMSEAEIREMILSNLDDFVREHASD